MTQALPPRIALVAGELSGDILGAGLIRELKVQYPNAEFVGIGGPLMIAQGMQSWFDMEELSIMGLVEVLKHLPRLLKLRKSLLQQLSDYQPDIFIGIDAPDFNLGVEAKLKQQGIRTMHYVSPSVWAWRQGRIHKIAKAVDEVLALLPFEKAFYDQHQVPCRFVGHPMADDIPLHSEHHQARQALSLPEQGHFLALLPGSRAAEVERLGHLFMQTAQLWQQQHSDWQVIIPCANAKRRAQLEELVQDYPELTVHLVDGRSREVMAAANAIILASGTASLEAALVKRPLVISYKTNGFSYWLAQRLVKVKYIGLPNLLADNMLFPELIQHDATPENLFAALQQQVDSFDRVRIATLEQMHQSIRLDASVQAADAVKQQLETQPASSQPAQTGQ